MQESGGKPEKGDSQRRDKPGHCRVRIPAEADHHSRVKAITIPV
jgi:hypothetical protein